MGGGKRKHHRGHACWVCDRQLSNESFSGKGHATHVCRDCARLDPQELAHRQAVRDLERCITWEGVIPKKRRANFERFLRHHDPRIRALAERYEREDADNHECAQARHAPEDEPADSLDGGDEVESAAASDDCIPS